MTILYEKVTSKNFPMLEIGKQTRKFVPYASAITAIRVQDVAQHKWFNWDYGHWDANGPPIVTPGANNLYIAFYAVNTGDSGEYLMLNLIDLLSQAILATKGQVTSVGQGVGIEWTGTMPSSPYPVSLKEATNGVSVDITIQPLGGAGGGGGVGTNTSIVTVTDAITKKPVVGAKVTYGTQEVLTDTLGTAPITTPIGTGNIQISISQSAYLPKTVTAILPFTTLQVSMVPLWLIGTGAIGAVIAGIGIYFAVKK